MATRERSRTTRRGPAPPDHRLPRGRTPPEEPRDAPQRSIVDLIRQLADDTGTLVRQEIGLAKAEAAQTAKRVAADSGWIGAGAAVAAVGGICLVVALALLLGDLLDSYWLGTLITGLALVVIGAAAAWKGISDLRGRDLAPTATIETLREDAEWGRSELREMKRELKEPTT